MRGRETTPGDPAARLCALYSQANSQRVERTQPRGRVSRGGLPAALGGDMGEKFLIGVLLWAAMSLVAMAWNTPRNFQALIPLLGGLVLVLLATMFFGR